ncbi:uncharacterized protein [Amphiura filiformis]|uniref:uncharacterized protein isoform X2 n=1 Tax=Amphiura filiformis TaxID=82378 RepID=UPI003B2254D1
MDTASAKSVLSTPVVSTIQVKVPPATCAVTTSSTVKQNQTVLFAIPAPRSVGNGMLCMCRKIFWTSGPLVHCAYIPVTKEEAAKLLRGPSSINVLQNPGSKLLTVSSTGAIIGVQQTVGLVKPKPPVLVTQKIATQSGETKPSVGARIPPTLPPTATVPEKVAKVPSHSPAMPQPTTTPKKIAPTSNATCDIPMIPKISAVYSLAEHSARSASSGTCTSSITSNKYAFAIAPPKEGPVERIRGKVVNKIATKLLTKQVSSKPDSSVSKCLPTDAVLQMNQKDHNSVAFVEKNSLREQEGKQTKEDTNTRSSNFVSKDSTNIGKGQAKPNPYSKNIIRKATENSSNSIPLDLTNKVLTHPAKTVIDNRSYQSKIVTYKVITSNESVEVSLREATPLDLSNKVSGNVTGRTFSVSPSKRTYPSVE